MRRRAEVTRSTGRAAAPGPGESGARGREPGAGAPGGRRHQRHQPDGEDGRKTELAASDLLRWRRGWTCPRRWAPRKGGSRGV